MNINILLLLALVACVTSFSAPATKVSSPVGNEIFEFLKWGGSEPEFDVLEKTKEYVNSFTVTKKAPGPEWYHKDYVLRGPVIGPINYNDLREAQGGFNYQQAFPDLTIESFGFTIDPENPYRCMYFQRWRGTHTGTLTAGTQEYPATGRAMETPLTLFSVVWTPDQNIIYEQVGAVVDRFEGNTNGKAAVFGLFHTAGLDIPGTPGNLKLRLLQRVGHLTGVGGRSFSNEEDIPGWWKSKSRGADPNDNF